MVEEGFAHAHAFRRQVRARCRGLKLDVEHRDAIRLLAVLEHLVSVAARATVDRGHTPDVHQRTEFERDLGLVQPLHGRVGDSVGNHLVIILVVFL